MLGSRVLERKVLSLVSLSLFVQGSNLLLFDVSGLHWADTSVGTIKAVIVSSRKRPYFGIILSMCDSDDASTTSEAIYVLRSRGNYDQCGKDQVIGISLSYKRHPDLCHNLILA